jgi:LmbE family N-acetylglucosaminyl deacetylase
VCWTVFSASTEIREREAHSGANCFLAGADDREIRVRSFRDGFFPNEWAALKEVFEMELKAFEPDVIFTHYREDRHQDHRVVSDLTWNTFRDHFILEYEIPKYDGDLGTPNFFVPLEQAVCEQKVDGLLEVFTSQKDRSWFSKETFWGLLRLRGIEVADSYAEAFHVRKAIW